MKIVNDSKKKAYDYSLHIPMYENPKLLCDIVGNVQLHAWDSKSMHLLNFKDKVDDEEDSVLTRTDFHVNNYQTVETGLRGIIIF